jgi:hypothetical protein
MQELAREDRKPVAGLHCPVVSSWLSVLRWLQVWCECHGRCGGPATTGGMGKTGPGVTPCFFRGIFLCDLAWMLQNGKPDLLKKNVDMVEGAW